MNFKDILQMIIAAGVITGMVVGAMSYFATAADHKQLAQRLDEKITNDRIVDYQRQMWELEQRNGSGDVHKWKSHSDKDYYKWLQIELEKEKRKARDKRALQSKVDIQG